MKPVRRAEQDADAAVSAAETRIADAERQAQEAIERARAEAEALVRAANDARAQAATQAAQADQRAAASRRTWRTHAQRPRGFARTPCGNSASDNRDYRGLAT